MSGIDLDAQAANAGARAFGPGLALCPDCGHGIDPHGADPGGPCGVSGCPCLMQPNGIACLLIDERDELLRWKEEALPVLAGLENLGRALDVPLGQRITGDVAAKRAEELRATVARVEALADWHDTVAWLNGAGSRDVSKTHRDAAARLREALAGDQP